MSTEKPTRGRPVGSKTADRIIADEEQFPPTNCPVCRSQNRAAYNSVQRIDGEGITPRGSVYTAVELRPTKCTDCGQARMDRRYILAR